MTLYLLNLSDLVTTLVGLACGMVEMNPLVRVILGVHPALFPLVKIAVFPLCFWLERKAKTYRLARYGYKIAVWYYAAVVAWNMVNIGLAVIYPLYH